MIKSKGMKQTLNRTVYGRLLLAAVIVTVSPWSLSEETVELPAKTDDLEVVEFKSKMEDRLSRDVQAYLGHNRFIINVDAELKKTRTVKKNQPPVQQKATQQSPLPDPTLLSVPNQQPLEDFELPGLPINDVTVVGDDEELRRMRDEVRQLQLEAEQARALANQTQNTQPETTIGFSNTIERLLINLVVDSDLTQQQEAFLRNLIIQKAALNEVRGDELTIVRTDFMRQGSDSEEEPVEEEVISEETTEEVLPWYKEYFELILFGFFVLLLLSLLWLAYALLRKKPENTDLKELFSPELAPPMKEINPMPGLAAPEHTEDIDYKQATNTLRQEIISLGLGQPNIMQGCMDELIMQGDKSQIPVSLYRSLGRNLFKSLFPTVPEERLNQITIYLAENDLEDEQIYNDMSDFHKEVVQVVNQGFNAEITPFRFLEKLNDAQISYLLKSEEARIKALVISQLPAHRSAEILKRIPKKELGNVMTELGNFEHFPVDTFKEVANRLARKSLKVPSFENLHADGITVLMKTLDNMSTAESQQIMNQLKQDNPDTFYRLRQVYYTFADLIRTPQEVLSNVLREVERRTLAASLMNTPEKLQIHVLDSLPQKLRIAVKEELKFADNSVTDETIEGARLVVVGKVRDLIKAGRFSMDDLIKSAKPDQKSKDKEQAKAS